MGDFATMVSNDYGLKHRGTTVQNTQANAIREQIDQTIGNTFRTFDIYNNEDLDTLSAILGATMLA
jgi:hypothetical protein